MSDPITARGTDAPRRAPEADAVREALDGHRSGDWTAEGREVLAAAARAWLDGLGSTGDAGASTFIEAVQAEKERAQRDHGQAYASDHEAYAVLLEEVDELWAWVKAKRAQRDRVAMREELVQIAAVVWKWAEQLEARERPAPEPQRTELP